MQYPKCLASVTTSLQKSCSAKYRCV